MANEERVKKYMVTLSLRFPSVFVKIIFGMGAAFGAAAAVGGVYSLIAWNTRFLGIIAILAALCFLWLFAARSISESVYSSNLISFGEKYIKFYTKEKTYELLWENSVDCGIVKTWLTKWVYVSDHRLAADEFKEFPEKVRPTVMYFDYDTVTWDEFMKFVPEPFARQLLARKAELKIKETIKKK